MTAVPIYWTLVDRTRVDLDHGSPWLSPAEQQTLAAFRFPKRRDEWLLGRYAAKSLLRSLPAYRALSPQVIEVHNAPEGVPALALPVGTPSPGCLTISHSGPYALCALSAGPDLRIGADLERVETRSEDFIEDYFTPGEREMVHAARRESRDLVATLVWSLKEAMLKALGVGLRWDTRRVEVSETDSLPGVGEDWHALQVSDHENARRPWAAWAQARDGYVLTAAALPGEGCDPGAILLSEQAI
jgi:4'-phosphopantetheinyl transferase